MGKQRTVEAKVNIKNSMIRLAVVFVALLLQIFVSFVLVRRLENSMPWINLTSRILSIVLCIAISSMYKTSALKLPWIIIIMIFPVWGSLLFLLIGTPGNTKRVQRVYTAADTVLEEYLPEGLEELRALEETDKSVANIFKYIKNYANFPIYNDSEVEFFDDTNEALDALKSSLSKARRFIFMEYHAIEEAEAFGGIKEILADRVKAGVDVRIIYDDIGSIGFINKDFMKRMEAIGVKAEAFNPVSVMLNVFVNNRDHRKVTVVDGEVAFTGGYNLADEYFNITHPYGVWKDSGIKVIGNAAKSFTMMFLEMWVVARKRKGEKLDVEQLKNFFPEQPPAYSHNQYKCEYIAPYADSPIDNEHVGQNVYMGVINRAKDYVWFMTPYLVLSDELQYAFRLAAKRGVDVRIITPGIPDKKVVFEVTRSFYSKLAEVGVKIYEYTPGFVHSKQCVSDDDVAACGTINLDFRSLYHHFENGCLMYNCSAIADIRADFENMFSQCREVTKKYTGPGILTRCKLLILRLFAGML